MNQYIKSFVSFSIGTWIRAVIAFFSTPIISYLIVPDEFGKAAMFTLVYNISLLTSLVGFDQSFVRYYYQESRRNELFWECILLPLINGSIISAIFIFFEEHLSKIIYGRYYHGIGIFFSIAIMAGILQSFNRLSIRMQKKGLLYSVIDIVNSLGNLGGTLIFALYVSKNFYAIAFGQISGNILALVLGFIVDKEFRRFSRVNIKKIKELLNYGFPLLPNSLLFWLFSSIDRISLRQYSSFTEIGLYSAAFKIVSVVQLFQAGFINFWIPLAYEKFESHPNPKNFFRKANQIVSAIFFLIGLSVFMSKDFLFLLFAQNYRSASSIVPFLILQPIMYVISETTTLGINFAKKTYWHIVVTGVSAIVNFAGNQFLVPRFGARGAAISTGFAYVVFFTLRTIISEKLYPVGFKLRKIYLGILIISVVAFLGTFQKNSITSYSSSVTGTILIALLYKSELISLKKNLTKSL